MGFLDKLFGRGKDAAEDLGDKAQDLGSKAADTASDVADKAQDTVGDAKSRISGEDDLSETGQAEQRLDDARDQAFKTEDRIP